MGTSTCVCTCSLLFIDFPATPRKHLVARGKLLRLFRRTSLVLAPTTTTIIAEEAPAAATTTIAVRVQWCGEIENETMDLRAGEGGLCVALKRKLNCILS